MSAKIFVAGFSYKTAPVEVRERLAVPHSRLGCYGCSLKIAGGLSELVVLSTCNRVEIYGVAPHINGNVDRLVEQLCGGHDDVRPHIYLHEGADAIDHLFSVAGGLDSMVLGETEITGQVKNAYETAQRARLTGKVLNRAFQTALQTAKKIRTQTNIGRGATSVGSVAVQLAEKMFGASLAQKTVMIIGAGQMAEACLRHLAKKGIQSIIVANRSIDRAQKLAEEFGGRAVNFMDDGIAAMRQADIVISSTGCPETILDREDVAAVMETRRHKPLVLIDIAVPRDIDPAVQKLENAFLYNIDDLEEIVRENVLLRAQELARCQEIVDQQTAELMTKLNPTVPRPVPADVKPASDRAWEIYGAVCAT
jgi:glutamyl-tRNA reductase